MARKKQKNEFNPKSFVCLIIVIILFILLFNAPKKWFDPNGTLKTQEANKQETKTVAQQTKIAVQQTSTAALFTCQSKFTITVDDFLNDLNSNNLSRREKYNDGCYSIKGYISPFRNLQYNGLILHLVSEQGTDVNPITIFVPNDHVQLLDGYNAGDKVVILGRSSYKDFMINSSITMINISRSN